MYRAMHKFKGFNFDKMCLKLCKQSCSAMCNGMAECLSLNLHLLLKAPRTTALVVWRGRNQGQLEEAQPRYTYVQMYMNIE